MVVGDDRSQSSDDAGSADREDRDELPDKEEHADSQSSLDKEMYLLNKEMETIQLECEKIAARHAQKSILAQRHQREHRSDPWVHFHWLLQNTKESLNGRTCISDGRTHLRDDYGLLG